MEIKIDDLSDPRIAAFLEEHIEEMKSVSPPESKHALDLKSLRKADITFWAVWIESDLVGCGALKELDAGHSEIKSMRTSSLHRGKGVASKLLKRIMNTAEERGYRRLSLEIGSMPFFGPARALYARYGFERRSPFSSYKEDPNSVFMKVVLNGDD